MEYERRTAKSKEKLRKSGANKFPIFPSVYFGAPNLASMEYRRIYEPSVSQVHLFCIYLRFDFPCSSFCSVLFNGLKIECKGELKIVLHSLRHASTQFQS